jgi:hypothetical protein
MHHLSQFAAHGLGHVVPARWFLAAAATALLVCLAESASAAITVGSDLTRDEDVLIGCIGATSCTGVQTQIPGRQVTSPIDGVIVRWRVGDGVGPLTLRVFRAEGGALRGVARSDTVTPTVPTSAPGQPPNISTFATRIPVRAGDLGGLDLTPDSALGYRAAPARSSPTWNPRSPTTSCVNPLPLPMRKAW